MTKAEACKEFKVSLSTLDRWISSGRVQIKKEPHGRRHRVYVVLDDVATDDGVVTPSNTLVGREGRPGGSPKDDVAQAVAQEQIRGLEEMVGLLKEQLKVERERYDGFINDLTTGGPVGTKSRATTSVVAVLGRVEVKATHWMGPVDGNRLATVTGYPTRPPDELRLYIWLS